MGMSQMCTGAGDYFRTSKPHSEKLCGITPGGFMLWRTDNSATQRRRATIFRPATAAAHITYDRHISKRQSLNAIFTRVNPSIGIK